VTADPAASRHRLGARLRDLRQARRLRLEDVAAQLGVVPSHAADFDLRGLARRVGRGRVRRQHAGGRDRKLTSFPAPHGTVGWMPNGFDLVSAI